MCSRHKYLSELSFLEVHTLRGKKINGNDSRELQRFNSALMRSNLLLNSSTLDLSKSYRMASGEVDGHSIYI